MGGFFSKITSFFDKKANILMLGLDNAGKTTILYQLKLNKSANTIPTIGFNVETVQYRSLNLTIWDVGGQEKIRQLWRHYYNNIDILIFVIDSNDTGRIEEAKKELHYLASEDELRDCIILLYSNKTDLPNSMNIYTLGNLLELNSLKQKWFVQRISAINNDGIYEGLDWVKKFKKKN